MTEIFDRYSTLDPARERKQIEEAIQQSGLTLENFGDGTIQIITTGSDTDLEGNDDLGMVSNIEEVDCSDGTGAASPNTHWTRVSGPTGASATLTLILPAVSVFGAVDQTKVISTDATVDGSHVVNIDVTNIKNSDGSDLNSLMLVSDDNYVVLRLFDMTQWRVIKVSGAPIDPALVGFTGTITAADLATKDITVLNGIITDFS